MNAEQRIVVFDLETSGLNPLVHAITEFAAIALDAEWRELESFDCKIQFDPATAESEALRVNGYDPEIWASEALAGPIAMGKIADFFRRHATVQKVSQRSGVPYQVARLCGHNVRFDAEFLATWFKRANQFCPAACYEALDTCDLARWIALFTEAQPKNFQLESLCFWLDIPLDKAHSAIADARACAELARRLIALGL